MAITTADGIIARISSGYEKTAHINGMTQVQFPNLFSGGSNPAMSRGGYVADLPGSFESGVSGYIPTQINLTGSSNASARMVIVAEMIDMGSIDISGASGTFTDGSAMPTRTQLGASNALASPVWCEAETAPSATPGTLNVTYTDQDGNTGISAPATNINGSAVARSGCFLPLDSSDWGVRDITGATRSGGTTPTGVIRFWGLIPLCAVNLSPTNITTPEDLINGGMVRRLRTTGTKIGLILHSPNGAYGIMGSIRFVGDST